MKDVFPNYVFFIINYCSAQLFSGPFYFSVDKINDEISISSNIPKDHYLYYDKLLVTDSKNKKIELDKYPLSTALARPLIAENLVNLARELNADAVAHGCTGKGNDQVRFDLAIHALGPDLQLSLIHI